MLYARINRQIGVCNFMLWTVTNEVQYLKKTISSYKIAYNLYQKILDIYSIDEQTKNLIKNDMKWLLASLKELEENISKEG
ncbi:hypothetical protein ACFL4T_03690 [candidate division KSB1 bacterium]